jgi:hypothetical protein
MGIPQTFHSFVLTDEHAVRNYGCAIVFYERQMAAGAADGTTTMLPDCLLLLSHHPFVSCFRHYLGSLLCRLRDDWQVPFERTVLHLVHELACPPRGRTSVQTRVGDGPAATFVRFARPPALPLLDTSLDVLFAHLSVPNVLLILSFLIGERTRDIASLPLPPPTHAHAHART